MPGHDGSGPSETTLLQEDAFAAPARPARVPRPWRLRGTAERSPEQLHKALVVNRDLINAAFRDTRKLAASQEGCLRVWEGARPFPQLGAHPRSQEPPLSTKGLRHKKPRAQGRPVSLLHNAPMSDTQDVPPG